MVVGDAVDDTTVQYRPLFSDASAESGRHYFYRVTAQNAAGKSAASNVVGPVDVTHRTLVDDCRDLSHVAETIGDVEPTTGDDRRRREDLHRPSIPAGGAVIYRVDAPIESWEATFFVLDGAVNGFSTEEVVVDGDTDRNIPIWTHPSLDWGYTPKGSVVSD